MSEKEKPTEQNFSDEVHTKYESKKYSEHYDPCQEAANKSIRCIHRNPGNKDLCNDYFQAYRDCRQAWAQAQKDAKRKKGTGWFS